MSILFCTPCFGGMVHEPHFSSCLMLKEDLTLNGVDHAWYTLANESLIPRARNNCVDFFLKETVFDSLMFLDADIEFTVEDVAKIYNMDKDISVGVYRMKKTGSKYAAWVDGKLVDDLGQYEEPIKVDYAGTGFMMIHRKVFEKLRDKMEKYENSYGRQEAAFFMDPIEDGIHLSEDYFFCKRARESGIDVWMDPSVRLKHHGTIAYE